MAKDENYFSFCGGSTLKNEEISLLVRPDVAFKIKRLAAKENKTVEEYILSLLYEHVEKNFPSHKDLYKKLFEKR